MSHLEDVDSAIVIMMNLSERAFVGVGLGLAELGEVFKAGREASGDGLKGC